ncbi:MAG TPA: GGDEF domain-containing protein [Vicinamibacterales bacterium]|nr:GGDEF domain-containing protein [Vicinamibacterales bacterium]
MRSVSNKRVSAPRAARRARRQDLAARLKSGARALRARIDRRDALIEAVREANATLDPRKVADWLVRQAQEWIPAPCWVVIAHDLNGHLNVLADAGLIPNLGPSLWSSANWVMRHGTEFFSGDLAKDSRGGPGAVGSAMAFPLLSRHRSVGVLVGLDRVPSSTTPVMGPSLVLALRALLEPSAIALDNALALQKAEALSVTDDLTRLSNSRYLNVVLRRESKRAIRNGRPLSLLFLDLDSFKQVNDKHGHLAGSKVLVEAAAVIRGCARETDVVARFGGDEFSLVLPETGAEGALSVAMRILERMRASRFLTSDGLAIRQTASIGVATLTPDEPRSAEELMREADMAMYRVKAAGKDGIHIAQEGS